jgi:hypothetical protein
MCTSPVASSARYRWSAREHRQELARCAQASPSQGERGRVPLLSLTKSAHGSSHRRLLPPRLARNAVLESGTRRARTRDPLARLTALLVLSRVMKVALGGRLELDAKGSGS